MQSKDGRILILQVVIDDMNLVFANIYAPNDPGAQHRFYLQLLEIVEMEVSSLTSVFSKTKEKIQRPRKIRHQRS